MQDSEALEIAQRLHREHIVIDTMSPNFVSEWVLTPAMVEIAKQMQAEGKKRSVIWGVLSEHLIEHCVTDPETREAYIAYWKRSGVTAISNTVYGSGPPDSAWDLTVTRIGRAGRLLDALQGQVVHVRRAADIESAHKAGKQAVIYNTQNADPVGDKLDRVDTLHGLGVRVLQLTYNLRNRFGEGCLERHDGGLSRLGCALIGKLNERRIVVDVSHGSPLTALDAVAVSKAPVIASHTAARALSGHARGLPDEALRAIAKSGGYVGIVALPAFIVPQGGDARAAQQGKPTGWATVDTIVDHILHAVNVAGEDHVGIGTDWGKPYYNALTWTASMTNEPTAGFDWVGWRQEDRFDPNMQVCGFETWDKWPSITAAMLQRGMAERTVAKIIGGNFLRVFREVCG